ncbi:unnamed protein product, partial [Trichobilharzia regenti]
IVQPDNKFVENSLFAEYFDVICYFLLISEKLLISFECMLFFVYIRTSCPKEWQACCDPTRCKLRKGAECAGGPCCDIVKTNPNGSGNQSSIQCKLKASGTICRNESGNCDLPEYCDGQSQWCPADVYKADGELCYTDEGRRVSFEFSHSRICF